MKGPVKPSEVLLTIQHPISQLVLLEPLHPSQKITSLHWRHSVKFLIDNQPVDGNLIAAYHDARLHVKAKALAVYTQMGSMADLNGWLLAVQKKIAVVLDTLNRKELLDAAVFILFKLGAEAVVIPLIVFFKAANRKAVRVYRNGETVQHLVRFVKDPQ